MLSVARALEEVLSHAVRLPAVAVPSAAALGRTLAENVTSDIDSPPWDKSLVDGYALRSADIESGSAMLTVIEEVTAGRMPTRAVEAGAATRIMTGAPLPAGADAVVMVERTELMDSQNVRISASVKPGQNILRRAVSMQRGQVALQAGQRIRPIEVGVLAEVGRTRVNVIRAPRVAILATGDELVEAETTPAGGQIRNSNGPMLAALVEATGADPVLLGIARDYGDDLRAKITAGLAADVLVLSGGVSAGVLDLVPKTFIELGVREVFHKIDLKPGKPIWFGVAEQNREGRSTLVFGLPGNPVSTLVCFGLFVRPALTRLAGGEENLRSRRATLREDFQQRDARPTYFPAVIRYDGERDTVSPLVWRGSADLRALADANCLAYFPGGERLFHAGEHVEIFPL